MTEAAIKITLVQDKDPPTLSLGDDINFKARFKRQPSRNESFNSPNKLLRNAGFRTGRSFYTNQKVTFPHANGIINWCASEKKMRHVFLQLPSRIEFLWP